MTTIPPVAAQLEFLRELWKGFSAHPAVKGSHSCAPESRMSQNPANRLQEKSGKELKKLLRRRNNPVPATLFQRILFFADSFKGIFSRPAALVRVSCHSLKIPALPHDFRRWKSVRGLL